MENDDRDLDDVPESWEEASEKPYQALENKIEEAKMKSRQQLLQQQQQQCARLVWKLNLLSKIYLNFFYLFFSSSDHCMVDCRGTTVDTNPLQVAGTRTPAAPTFRILKRPDSAGDLEKFKDGINKNSSNQLRNKSSAGSGSGGSNSSTKSLEERATAYAQARERIFGVVDPVIHEDLPIQ